MATYWVSFATDEEFRGVAIVDVESDSLEQKDIVRDVIKETIARGCNGGRDTSVQAQKIPGDKIPDSFKNRLLTQDEVDHLNAGGSLH